MSSLGGTPHEVVCPWCEGSGHRIPGIDAQEHPAEGEPASRRLRSRRRRARAQTAPEADGPPKLQLAMALELTTAGESHGPGLTCIVQGMPAGLALDRDALDRDLARRQLGHGRGGRMKIESDRATVTAGVRHGRTLGGPICLQVANRDYANWEERMNPWPVDAQTAEVHLPRPGHADLVGTQKYGLTDVRDILERASARETAARVAGGAVCKAFLAPSAFRCSRT